MGNVVLLEPARWVLCVSCGHARGWHIVDGGGCTHEIKDEDTWIRCGCEGWAT